MVRLIPQHICSRSILSKTSWWIKVDVDYRSSQFLDLYMDKIKDDDIDCEGGGLKQNISLHIIHQQGILFIIMTTIIMSLSGLYVI